MAFTGAAITLAALMEITLPEGQYVRLVDGGFLYWLGNKFDCIDPVFGTIGSAESFEEKTGDEAPGGKISFLPPSTSAAASLSSATYQNTRMRFWLAQVDTMTGTIVGTPEQTADLAIDTTTLKTSKGQRIVDVEFVSAAERLFLIMRGNALNNRFHQACYAGELGMVNATGMPRSSAWGVAAPA